VGKNPPSENIMKLNTLHSPLLLLFLVALPLFITGCRQVEAGEILKPTIQLTPTENQAVLSADAQATLQSLVKVDDYPLYVMHYSGEYDYSQIGSTWSAGRDFSCSLFAALGLPNRLYGRNFDWKFSPAMILFTDPPDGYASVSMVDLEYLGIRPEDAKSLTDLSLADRTGLLSAPSMPFDGMNEYGLTVGMTDVPANYVDHAAYDPSKPTIGSIGIIRLILDQARNVDEAIAFFEHYNIDFRGGPLLHYLIADRAGKAALVEFYQKEMVVLPNKDPWHLATNHFRCNAQGYGGCLRYRTISEQLSSVGGYLTAENAMQLLSQVRQAVTQWSVVYDMTSGDIQLALGGNYKSFYSFTLDMVQE
jgi:hypothetical protein